jgi:hypothetical protein
MQIVSYLLDNAAVIIQALTALVTAASLISALTPSPKDDGVVKFLSKVINTLALNVGNVKNK